MEIIKLTNQKILNSNFPKLIVILDDDGLLPLSVNAWLIHIWNCRAGYQYKQFEQESRTILGHQRLSNQIKRKFGIYPLEENTIQSYTGHVFRFLTWLNNERIKNNELPSIHSVHQLSARHINHYLNEILPKTGVKKSTITAYSAAILSMMNFFHAMGWCQNLTLSIHGPTDSKIAMNNYNSVPIHYISRNWRAVLLRCCNNQRDRLIIRMGCEVGLRAMENCGLLLNTHITNSKRQAGLIDLFNQLDNHPSRNKFEYMLNGRYAKRGKSRLIYFDRELLSAMRHYYETERYFIVRKAKNNPNSLFLNTDNRYFGTPISKTRPSLIFSKYSRELDFLDTSYVYHDLRHSFATELFHSELEHRGSQ